MTELTTPSESQDEDESGSEPSTDQTSTAPPKRRWSKTRMAIRALLVLTFLAGGISAGWWARGEQLSGNREGASVVPDPSVSDLEDSALEADQQSEQDDEPRAVSRSSEDSPIEGTDGDGAVPEPDPVVMLNVLDLTAAEARAALVDAGVDAGAIAIESIAGAGEAGLLIDQRPSPGEPLGDTVTLYVSEEVAMPDLLGLSAEDATEALESFGAVAVLETEYVHGAEAGLIVETVPAAGTPLTKEVAVVVAEAPSEVYLSELRSVQQYPWESRDRSASGFNPPGLWRVDSGCYYGHIQISGSEFPKSPICTPLGDDVAFFEYTLNRRVSRLEGMFGIGDFSDNSQQVTFAIYIDGQDPLSWTLSYGQSVPLDIDLSGVLRIRLQVARTTHNEEVTDITAGWGDARLIGSKAAIDDIIQNSGT